LTDSHIKLNSLDDMQECLSNSNHKIAFDYNEDTVSFVVDPSNSFHIRHINLQQLQFLCWRRISL
jgi:hypothetical protein